MKKIHFFAVYFAVLSCFSLSFCGEAFAKDSGAGKVIRSVVVRNNRSVSEMTILSNVRTRVGQAFSQPLLNDDLKRLYALGYFTDVSIDLEDFLDGVKVSFIVKEKPVLKSVTFSGNQALRKTKLKKEMKIVIGEMFNPSQLTADLKAIEALYESKGFALTNIGYTKKVDERSNEVSVTVIIDEKERVKIKSITVEGNEHIATKKLLKIMSTKKDSFLTSGHFKREDFDMDLENLRLYYERAGFLDVEVTPDLDYDDTGKRMHITINVKEGNRYEVGQIAIAGNKVFPEKLIRQSLKMATGEPYSPYGARVEVLNIQKFYSHQGYMFARINADSSLNPKTGRIDLTYHIEENDLAYIDKVKIRGNSKTKDVVIRREMRVYPGERFDGDKLQRSKERLYNLGFFEDVQIDTEDTDKPNKKDLVVEVKEAKTGEFSFGGGYSSIDKVIGFVEITQRNFDWANFPNFTGDGQHMSIRAEMGSSRQDYNLSWTEPWIFDYPLSFGFDLYQRTHKRRSSAGYGYDEKRQGGDLRLGKEFTEYLTGNLTYKYENVRISDISEDATADLKAEAGSNNISSLLFVLTQDTRDNVFSPTRGYVLKGGIEWAGGAIGGDKDFMKYTGGARHYQELFLKTVLQLRLRSGIVEPYGDSLTVPIYERFYAGGTHTIRGYEERRVGPRDASSNDPIGGESMLIGNVELVFPIFQDILKGAIFYDVGNVWEKTGDFASGNYKSGTGVGIRVKTPIGPVSIDYGIPLDSIEGEDEEGRVHFSMGQGF
ncbi:MAG: outer membrane protein assembly factor BamA [Candidatus Omnitrophica bacterium]|nr:outer membrane protein assembly factor BamA [Candidatus Omnitrophota bacterium]